MTTIKTKESAVEQKEHAEHLHRGGFGIIAGVNGPFKEYKEHLLLDLQKKFDEKSKSMQVMKLDIKDELTPDEKQAYHSVFSIKARMYHNHPKQTKKMNLLIVIG